MSEKEAKEVTVASISGDISTRPIDILPISSNGDDALEFLKQHAIANNFSQDTARMRILRRKIDVRVIPFLALSYLMNYLDKITLNVSRSPADRKPCTRKSTNNLQKYANVMGISKELHLKGNDYTNVSSAFWIAVLIAEFPSSKCLCSRSASNLRFTASRRTVNSQSIVQNTS